MSPTDEALVPIIFIVIEDMVGERPRGAVVKRRGGAQTGLIAPVQSKSSNNVPYFAAEFRLGGRQMASK